MLLERLQQVQERIAEAARRAGRDAGVVQLLAVTKTQPRSVVELAVQAGLLVLGENRVQEALSKYDQIVDRVELHLIGHLQSNKAKHVPGFFPWVDSVDSLKTAQAISRYCRESDSSCSLLVQFNSSGEESKSGYTTEEQLLADAEAMMQLPAVELRGVMTIGPLTRDEACIRAAFDRTRQVYERMGREFPDARIDVLSMGMSDDYEIAIESGSTQVRLGSALFGARR